MEWIDWAVSQGFVAVKFHCWNVFEKDLELARAARARFPNLTFMLDVENKDWSDLDMPWGAPRWNCNAQVVEAIPSWRVFIFGGVCDKHGEGRSMGIFDTSIGVLDMGTKK